MEQLNTNVSVETIIKYIRYLLRLIANNLTLLPIAALK